MADRGGAWACRGGSRGSFSIIAHARKEFWGHLCVGDHGDHELEIMDAKVSWKADPVPSAARQGSLDPAPNQPLDLIAGPGPSSIYLWIHPGPLPGSSLDPLVDAYLDSGPGSTSRDYL